MVLRCSVIAFALMFCLQSSRAELVTFEFAIGGSQAGMDLDGVSATGMTSATTVGPGSYTVTMSATPGATNPGGTPTFNANVAFTDFGIDIVGVGDPPDAPTSIDDGSGAEFMTFSFDVTNPIGAYTYEFVSVDLDRFTAAGEDVARMTFAGGGGGGSPFTLTGGVNVSGAGVWTNGGIPIPFAANELITLAYVSGLPAGNGSPAGFGIDSFTLDIVLIPEPSAFLAVGFLGCIGLAWRFGKQYLPLMSS